MLNKFGMAIAAFPRPLLAALIVLATTATIIGVAQLISAQEGPETEETEDSQDSRGHCWDHWLSLDATATPVPTPRPTAVPFCTQYPLHPACHRPTPVPPLTDTPVPPPPPTDTPVPPPPPTNTPAPRPTDTAVPRPTATPVPPPANTPVPPTPTRQRPILSTDTPTPTPTTPNPDPTPTLPEAVICPASSRSADQPAEPSHEITIVDLDPTMHPGQCDELRINVPGDVLTSVEYVVTLRASGGLYFNRSCTNQSESWRLAGRSWYRIFHAVWACEGHTRGDLTAQMRRADSEGSLSRSVRSVAIAPEPEPTPTPTPTRTPTPTATPTTPGTTPAPTRTPTRTPVPACNDLPGYRASSDDDDGVNPTTVLRIDSLDAIMHPGDCIDAGVFIGVVLPNKKYHISLRAEDGIGFYSQCAVKSTGFPSLTGSYSYQFSFPVMACEHQDGRGIITATVREHLGEVIATKALDVVMPPTPARKFVAVTTERGVCVLDSRHTSGEDGDRTPDGLAHYGSATILSGYTDADWLLMMFGQLPQNRCVMGMIESVSSRYIGEVITATATLTKTKNGGNLKLSTTSITCSVVTHHDRPCRLYTDYLFQPLSNVLDLVSPDSYHFQLSGTHRMPSGGQSVTLNTSAAASDVEEEE